MPLPPDFDRPPELLRTELRAFEPELERPEDLTADRLLEREDPPDRLYVDLPDRLLEDEPDDRL